MAAQPKSAIRANYRTQDAATRDLIRELLSSGIDTSAARPAQQPVSIPRIPSGMQGNQGEVPQDAANDSSLFTRLPARNETAPADRSVGFASADVPRLVASLDPSAGMSARSRVVQQQNYARVRTQPISQRLQSLYDAAASEAGIDEVRVFSGGQPSTGLNRTGSHRHDNGMAGDITLWKDGKMLDWANKADLPTVQAFVAAAVRNGATGIGAGPGYMIPGSLHVGFGDHPKGAPMLWGDDGEAKNAPKWLETAALQLAKEPAPPPTPRLRPDTMPAPDLAAALTGDETNPRLPVTMARDAELAAVAPPPGADQVAAADAMAAANEEAGAKGNLSVADMNAEPALAYSGQKDAVAGQAAARYSTTPYDKLSLSPEDRKVYTPEVYARLQAKLNGEAADAPVQEAAIASPGAIAPVKAAVTAAAAPGGFGGTPQAKQVAAILASGAPEIGVAPLPGHVVGGAVGNMMQEAYPDIRPNAVGKAGERGIGQWDKTRYTAMVKWTTANKLDPTSRIGQALFYSHELQSKPGVMAKLAKAKTPADAAAIIAKDFEQAGNPQMAKRIGYANQVGAGDAAAAAALPRAPGTNPTLAKVKPGGDPDPHVGFLQQALKDAYPNAFGHLDVDGQFGPETERAVASLNGATGDTSGKLGVAGPHTYSVLSEKLPDRFNQPLPPTRPDFVDTAGATRDFVTPPDAAGDPMNLTPADTPRIRATGNPDRLMATADTAGAGQVTNAADKSDRDPTAGWASGLQGLPFGRALQRTMETALPAPGVKDVGTRLDPASINPKATSIVPEGDAPRIAPAAGATRSITQAPAETGFPYQNGASRTPALDRAGMSEIINGLKTTSPDAVVSAATANPTPRIRATGNPDRLMATADTAGAGQVTNTAAKGDLGPIGIPPLPKPSDRLGVTDRAGGLMTTIRKLLVAANVVDPSTVGQPAGGPPPRIQPAVSAGGDSSSYASKPSQPRSDAIMSLLASMGATPASLAPRGDSSGGGDVPANSSGSPDDRDSRASQDSSNGSSSGRISSLGGAPDAISSLMAAIDAASAPPSYNSNAPSYQDYNNPDGNDYSNTGGIP